MSKPIHKNRNYYDFCHTVDKLRKKDNTCFICGSKEDIEPHHIRKVKQSNQSYAREDNIVLLCRKCHKKYHYRHKNADPKSFIEFALEMQHSKRQHYNRSLHDLKREREKLRSENRRLRQDLSYLSGGVYV